jgi:hypothetical protein
LQSTLANPKLPSEVRNSTTKRINLFYAVNDALSIALAEDESVLIFGKDVDFSSVFRYTGKLAKTYSSDRVFNTPLTKQSIIGFAIGAAAEGMRPVAKIQFADYVYPKLVRRVTGGGLRCPLQPSAAPAATRSLQAVIVQCNGDKHTSGLPP